MNKDNVIGALKRVKNEVVDKTSDVLAAPARAYYGVKKALSDGETKRIKQTQALQKMDLANVPDAGNESDPLFRYRVNEIQRTFDAEHARLKNK